MSARRHQSAAAHPVVDGDTCRCERVTTPAPWIVSTAHEVLAVQGVRVSWVPHGVRHARRIGSITTACGLPAHWFKNFHATPFVAGASETCADCNELFTQRGALPPAGGRVAV